MYANEGLSTPLDLQITLCMPPFLATAAFEKLLPRFAPRTSEYWVLTCFLIIDFTYSRIITGPIRIAIFTWLSWEKGFLAPIDSVRLYTSPPLLSPHPIPSLYKPIKSILSVN
jgi:hypothetical protein